MTIVPGSETCLALFGEQDVRPARHAVRALAASLPFDDRQVADITLAVAEACCNGVRYTTAGGPEPVVTIVTEHGTDHLAIEVADHGAGFAPQEPRMPQPRAECGRGIALMHALMDTVDIQSTARGTRVRMVKYFSR